MSLLFLTVKIYISGIFSVLIGNTKKNWAFRLSGVIKIMA